MFAVIYKWKIKPGSEEAFRKAWAERTLEIKKAYGGLGSRLHKSEEDSYIAYAQWPSKEAWSGNVGKKESPSQASKVMKEATLDFEILHTLDVLEDLLEHQQSY